MLGGLQGALGWYMVMSGLADRTDVSHFRLSAHLLLALAIMGALIWIALDLRRLARPARPSRAPDRLSPTSRDPVRPAALRRLGRRPRRRPGRQQLAADAGPLLPRRRRLVPRASAGRSTHDPYLIHFLHRWWAWVAVAALVVFARQVRRVDRRASLDRHPLGLRHPDPARHRHRDDRRRDLARRAAPGGRRAAGRRHGVGRARGRKARRMSVVSVYAVFADADEAERIGRTVVEERLAACVNILGPCRSIYRWQGEVETADEVAADPQDHRTPRPTR